jgi:dephospho-CoA kinase
LISSAGENVKKNRVVAVVGMTGSGKSEVARVFEQNSFLKIRFGDVTDDEVKKRGLPLNEENERKVRQQLRLEKGMGAYAILNMPRIEQALQSSSVVIDGLYSWDEYLLMKEKFGDAFSVLAVWSSPSTRYKRLTGRKTRPLTAAEAAGRDKAEIENSAKGGPIAIADHTICNEKSIDVLRDEVLKVIQSYR